MPDKGRLTRERILLSAEALILNQGFAGTSLDRVLDRAGVTKGAFFHHFKGKADLARAVLANHAEHDLARLHQWSRAADEVSADQLERMLIFLKSFETHFDVLGERPDGCVAATYVHEHDQFEAEIHDLVSAHMESRVSFLEAKFAALIETRKPAFPTKARALAESVCSLLQGGFIMARALNDAKWSQRQIAGFRRYLELLFAD